jgi:hypothetical protein
VAGSCEYDDEPSVSGAMELVCDVECQIFLQFLKNCSIDTLGTLSSYENILDTEP